MAHPETLLPMTTIEDPTERFISVVKFYLSGWHIKPPYVALPRSPLPAFFSFGGGGGGRSSSPMDNHRLTTK